MIPISPLLAYEIARIILKGIRDNKLGLAKFVKKNIPEFNPTKPDNFSSFYWPYSPTAAAVKPDGN